jgi:hypothetical protein
LSIANEDDGEVFDEDETNQMTDVCKVNTIKVEDFDEPIPIVQVRIGKFEIRNVLLDVV